MALVSQVQAAELLGVSRKAVYNKREQLEACGQARRIGAQLMYESEGLADTWLALTQLQPSNAARLEQLQEQVAGDRTNPLVEQAKRETEAAAAAGVIPGYPESRARREHFLARLAELEVQVREGQLVDAAAAKAATFERGRRVRNQIMGLPARIAGDLAAEADPARVAITLERELVECLTALAGGGDD